MDLNLYILPAAVFVAIVALGGALLLLRRRNVSDRLTASGVTPGGAPSSAAVGQMAGVMARLATGKPSLHLREELAQAGYHSPNNASVYLGLKMAMLGLGVVVGLVLAAVLVSLSPVMRLELVAVLGLAFFFIPNLVVYLRRRKRRLEVRCHLPDALDLLEVCVSAGMGTDMAWNAVADEMRRVSTVLADEMALANLEIHLGAHRAEAMRHMAVRTGEADLESLAAILVQSERLGTSIADALQAFAAAMREQRKHRAQEAAEAMAVKLLLPMILFIFPAILIVLIGPAGMRIAATFGGGGGWH